MQFLKTDVAAGLKPRCYVPAAYQRVVIIGFFLNRPAFAIIRRGSTDETEVVAG